MRPGRSMLIPRAVVSAVVLFVSLSVVAWRQGRALGVLEELDRVSRQVDEARDLGVELEHEAVRLTSRTRILQAAWEFHRLRPAGDGEMHFLERGVVQ